MPSNKQNLRDGATLYTSEAIKYQELQNLERAWTTSGTLNFTSTSSGIAYNSTTGEQGLATLLEAPLNTRIANASDLNEIGDTSALTTTASADLVVASNEINAKANVNGKYNPVTIETRNINVNSGGSFVKSDFNNIKINLATTIASGAQITVEIDDDGTTYNLYSDYAGTESIIELEQGVYDLVFRDDTTDFFYLAPRGADEWGGLQFVIDTQQFGGRLYHAEDTGDTLNELDTDTLLSINSASAPGTNPTGMGGALNRLYHTRGGVNLIYEIDKDTLLQLSNAPTPDTNPRDCGGINDRLYAVGQVADTIFELDLDTKLQISSASSPTTTPFGIGGIDSRLYHCEQTNSFIYELDKDTKLPISSAASPGGSEYSIGGTSTKLWYIDVSGDLIHRIDTDTKLSIESQSTITADPRGIGGIKSGNEKDGISITKVLYDGTEYELVDDSQFRVSGVSA